jgi:uncharacterized membrane protein
MTDPGPQVATPPGGEASPAEEQSRSSSMAVVGFILAVLGQVLFWIWATFGAGNNDAVGTYGVVGTILVGLAGAAVCVVAYREARRQHESKGLALAGTIIGAVPAVIVVGGLLLFFVITLIFGA